MEVTSELKALDQDIAVKNKMEYKTLHQNKLYLKSLKILFVHKSAKNVVLHIFYKITIYSDIIWLINTIIILYINLINSYISDQVSTLHVPQLNIYHISIPYCRALSRKFYLQYKIKVNNRNKYVNIS